MAAVGRDHGSGSRALLTVVGLGTAAVAGAAIALAVSAPPGARRQRLARGRSAARVGSSRAVLGPLDPDGSALFV